MDIRCPNCGESFDLSDKAVAEIINQIRDAAFEKEVSERVKLEVSSVKAESELNNERIMNTERKKHDERISELQAVITGLKENLAASDVAVQKAVLDCQTEYTAKLADMEASLKSKDAELAYYKDLKSKMSTKMIGESLEVHCENEFNKIRMAAFPNAYFEKDNVVSKESGSKGDYIFREFDADGEEIISIMFEMKNESDSTSVKKKNEHFFKELDKDRAEKKCEYAVLVTMLEPESDLYNQGIVDVSYRYDKMYVIRPQFFITIISLLRNAALNAVSIKSELKAVRDRNMDLSRFTANFDKFKELASNKCGGSRTKADSAIAEIDKAISRLEAAKTAIASVCKQIDSVSSIIDSTSVEKLCADSDSLLTVLKG